MNSVMTIPSAIYSLIMFGTAALVIFFGNYKASKKEAKA
jgi:BASS family bile acid:Na+ symporter